MAKKAGVHIYSEDNDTIVFVNDVLIGVYHRAATDAVITVKADGKYTDLFSGKTYLSRGKKLFLPFNEEECAKLLIRGEVL